MALIFEFTPDEARWVAEAAARWATREKNAKCEVERTPWKDAPYRTTLATLDGDPKILIDAQGAFSYHRPLAALASWIHAHRRYAELYVAVAEASEVQVRQLEEMKRDGVGLLLVYDDGAVHQAHPARNPALLVLPDPTLKYGDCRAEVEAAVQKFNHVDRKDGLRDMCELVERETEKVAVAAVRKGLLKMSVTDVHGMNWATKINALASPNSYAPPATPVLDASGKDDLHSFRGARNLVDHPARGLRAQQRREQQFAERMAQGPRLVSQLVSLRRKIARH